MSDYYLTKDELAHHGILGMKWGIRRFQNKDGSYTEEGKRRRRSDSYSDDYKKYQKLRKKNPKDLSTKEIEEINRRDNAMSQYNRNHQSVGQQFVNKLGPKIMEKSAEALAVAIIAAGTKYIKSKIG